jgi:DNA polymerase V
MFDCIRIPRPVPLRVNPRSRLRFFSSRVPAGFPSPADDHLDGQIDLNKILVENEPATFLTRASGDSMEGAGIYDDDLLIVNRALTAADGSIIVAEILGEFTLKRLRIIAGKPWLYPENARYQPMQVTADMGFTVWGVVKHTIRIHGHGRP